MKAINLKRFSLARSLGHSSLSFNFLINHNLLFITSVSGSARDHEKADEEGRGEQLDMFKGIPTAAAAVFFSDYLEYPARHRLGIVKTGDWQISQASFLLRGAPRQKEQSRKASSSFFLL